MTALDTHTTPAPPVEIRALVEGSGQRYVLLKPLCDSHRVPEFLDGLGTPSPGRAIWAFRDVDGRVRSAVEKFGDANRKALRDIASGETLDSWQAGGLSQERLARRQARRCDPGGPVRHGSPGSRPRAWSGRRA